MESVDFNDMHCGAKMNLSAKEVPPAHLDGIARNIWFRCIEKAKGTGDCDELTRLGIETVAGAAAVYFRAIASSLQHEFKEELRIKIRAMMASLDLLDDDDDSAAPDGFDRQIARLVAIH